MIIKSYPFFKKNYNAIPIEIIILADINNNKFHYFNNNYNNNNLKITMFFKCHLSQMN